MGFTGEQVDMIEKFMADEDIPGAAVAIVRNGGIVAEGGFGLADVSAASPATSHTVWPICSLTKSITATAIMQLVEQGSLMLDEPVQTYLPHFRVKDAEASRKMTARLFLKHNSGMGRTGHQDRLREEKENPYPTRAALVKALDSVVLQSAPGKCWSYCNEGYATLGHMIETISGVPLEECFQRNILDRVGMHDTYVRFSDWRSATDRMYPYAKGDTGPFDTGDRHGDYVVIRLPEDYQTFLSTGGIASTAHDLAKYQLAVMDYEHSPLLSAGSLDQMHSPSFQYGDTGWGYGFGWQVFWSGDVRVIGHAGGLPGVSNYSMLVPSERAGVVILTNRGDRKAFLLAERLMGTVLERPLFRDSTSKQLKFQTKYPAPGAEALAELYGGYEFKGTTAKVKAAASGVVIEVPGRRGGPDQTLVTVAIGPDTFLDQDLAAVIHFVRNENGSVVRFLHGGYAYERV